MGKCVIHDVSVESVMYWMLAHCSFLVVMHQVLGQFLQSVYPSMKGLNICLRVTRKLSLETRQCGRLVFRRSTFCSSWSRLCCHFLLFFSFLLWLSFVECFICFFLFGLHFEPEDGSEMFLRDVGLSPNCMELQARRLYSSSWCPILSFGVPSLSPDRPLMQNEIRVASRKTPTFPITVPHL
jgi:hypothetical protein